MGTWVVTGGSSGIGARIVHDLASRGEHVTVWDMQSPAPGSRAVYRHVDLLLRGSVVEAAAEITEPLNAFIHCAGITATTAIGNPNLAEQMRAAYEVHVVSMVLAVQSLLDKLIAGKGCVVAITSAAMEVVYPAGLAYGSSKAALARVITQLAVELGGLNIRVNGVAPGAVLTPMSAAAWSDDAFAIERKSYIPLGYQADPGVISDAVLFLASENARYITGETIYVDGGVRHGIFNTAARAFAEASLK